MKEWVYDKLGNRCKLCGDNERLFLTIDHIGGGGRAHRQAHRGRDLYRHIKQDPHIKKKYRILCFNCNCSLLRCDELTLKRIIRRRKTHGIR